MKRHLAMISAAMLIAAGLAWAGGIKTWSAGERVSAADLNANFSHIHNSLRGAGHTLITNADISSGAAIGASKIAFNDLLPRGYAFLTTFCTGENAVGTACTSISSGRLASSIKSHGSVGNYDVHITPNPTNANFILQLQSYSATTLCIPTGQAAVTDGGPHAVISCTNQFDGGPVNAQFSVIYMDDT